MTPRAVRRALLAVVDGGAWLAPASVRARWRAQWRADLWHRCDALERAGLLNGRTARHLAARAGAALWHALWLRLTRHGGPMVLHDIRHATRALSARPVFTAIAVATLALGIGANTVIFSWVEATLLRPIPGIARAGDIAAVYATTATRDDISLSYPNYRDLRDAGLPGVEAVAVFSAGALSLRTPAGAERLWGAVVSGNLFDLLGVTAAHGRVLSPDDDVTPGGHPVAVLSHQAWRRRFGGRPDVIGTTLIINEHPFTVVGVAAPGFHGPQPLIALEVFIPVAMQGAFIAGNRLEARTSGWLQTLVRRAPGTDLAVIQRGLDVAAARLAAAHPDANDARGLRVFPLWRQPSGGSAQLLPVMSVLAGVVALLLALVCANLAGLLLARASGRQRELAVRVSLGATRAQIVRLVVTETTVLAVVAGAAAALVTSWSGPLLLSFIPPLPLPIAIDAGLSARVALVATVLAAGAGILVGLVPGWQAARGSLVAPLKDGAASGGTARTGRLRQVLIVGQVAAAMVLLVSAGLFVRTLDAARTLDVGFQARQGLVGMLDVGGPGAEPARGLAQYRRITAALATLPGVEAVALGQRLPLTGTDSSDRTVEVEGYTPAAGEELHAYYASVGPGYFETLRLPMREGRDFTDRDESDSPPVVIVNETMARRYWRDRSALGGRVKVGDRWVTVVAVVADTKYSSLTEPPRAFMYLPVAQAYRAAMRVVLRTSAPPDTLVPAVRETLARVAPGVPLFDVQTLEQHRAFALFLFEMAATLLGVFGGTAVALAALGLYGVVAQGVAARTREIGVRISLGASRGDIGRLIVGQGAALAAVGVAVGLAAAVGLTRLFASQLLGVSPLDPAAFAGTTLLVAATALAASAVPAWRAARLDPVRALRAD